MHVITTSRTCCSKVLQHDWTVFCALRDDPWQAGDSNRVNEFAAAVERVGRVVESLQEEMFCKFVAVEHARMLVFRFTIARCEEGNGISN